MKVNIEIDCTPEEARNFFGLPDVKPIQAEMLKQMQRQMEENIEAINPELMIKAWMQPGMEGFGYLQKMMSTAMDKEK